VKKPGIVFIDDYAHHPEELKALLTGAKTLFKGRRCTIVFQPHLFSRTRDFADGFAESLDLADQVILLPIYPARELPIEGVTSELILDKMKKEQKQVMSKEELPAFIQQRFIPEMDPAFGELLILAGAGDIDTLVAPVKKIIEENL
jgi:UDP-N-acetylmuramate--alanine ligase